MRESICAALAEDDDLVRLNDVRKEELLSRHSEKDRERMRQRFAQLMERLPPGIDAATPGKGRDLGGRPRSGSRSREPLQPLPTKEEPTFIRIANANRPIPVRLDRHVLIRLESDAPDAYLTTHIHAKLTMASQPQGILALESRSDFHGGRARLTIKPTEAAKEGAEGTLSVFLFTPDDKALTAEVGFRVEVPKDASTSGDRERTQVKAPEPIPVFRDGWQQFGWDDANVSEAREDLEGGKIYVNADNRHLARLLRGGGYQEQGMTRMRNNFVLYVAFYTWARHVAMRGRDVGVEGKDFEDYQTAELDRLAQTVIHSIAAGARLEDQE